jgi:hypothetical protein
MHGEEVCWFPRVGGCFAKAVAIWKAGTRDISVCEDHDIQMVGREGFRRISLP